MRDDFKINPKSRKFSCNLSQKQNIIVLSTFNVCFK